MVGHTTQGMPSESLEVNGYVYTPGEPLQYPMAVRASALSESWWKMPLEWRLACIYTCDFFGVRLEEFLMQVGEERERIAKGLDTTHGYDNRLEPRT